MKYRDIKEGDLLWSRMPLPFYKMIFIKKNHRVRPYLILKKSIFGIYALPCTSNLNTYINKNTNYILKSSDYKLPHNKNSMIIIYKKTKLKRRLMQDKIVRVSNKDFNKIKELVVSYDKKYNI